MSEHGPLVDTFLELVQIDSESKNEREICDYIKNRLDPFASSMIEDDTGEKIGGNCGNLIVKIDGNSSGAPTILLNAHMDSVKPANGIIPVIENDIIRSKGDTVLGADDKAGLAVIIEAVRTLEEHELGHGALLLAITVSEETGLLGARHIDPSLLGADYGFSLDCPGPAGVIYNASPFHDTILATIAGRAAHAGMEPEKGISAIRIASNAISKMDLGRIDDETTANVGFIKGGKATNIVPDTAFIEAEARSHDPEKLKAQIEAMAAALDAAAREAGGTVDTEIRHEYKGYKIDTDSPVIKAMRDAAAAMNIEPAIMASGGGSDANMFNEYGVPTIPTAAGMRNCHTTDESISISELEAIFEWHMKALVR